MPSYGWLAEAGKLVPVALSLCLCSVGCMQPHPCLQPSTPSTPATNCQQQSPLQGSCQDGVDKT
jgi:hypothetical protein